jgi:hypothetical protein
MNNDTNYPADMSTAVGSPFSWVRPGTMLLTDDSRQVEIMTIGASGVWTRDGYFFWDEIVAKVRY